MGICPGHKSSEAQLRSSQQQQRRRRRLLGPKHTGTMGTGLPSVEQLRSTFRAHCVTKPDQTAVFYFCLLLSAGQHKSRASYNARRLTPNCIVQPPRKHQGRRWDSKWERIPSSGRGPSYECTFNYSVWWVEEIKHPSRRRAMLNYTRKKLPLGKETRVKSAKCGGGGGG